jgi:hypothetical protein
VDIGSISGVLENHTAFIFKAKRLLIDPKTIMKNRIGNDVMCLQHTACHRSFPEEEGISKYVILIGLLRMVKCVKSM